MGMLVRRFPVLLGAAALVFSASACRPLVTVEFRHADSSPTPGIAVPAEVQDQFPGWGPATYRLSTSELDLWLTDKPRVRDDSDDQTIYDSPSGDYVIYVERSIREGFTAARLIKDLMESDTSVRDVERLDDEYSEQDGLTRYDARYVATYDDMVYGDEFTVLQEGDDMVVIEWSGMGHGGDPNPVRMAIAATASLHFDDAADSGSGSGAGVAGA
jgi:hypothetical protein